MTTRTMERIAKALLAHAPAWVLSSAFELGWKAHQARMVPAPRKPTPLAIPASVLKALTDEEFHGFVEEQLLARRGAHTEAYAHTTIIRSEALTRCDRA